jgi:hypothetical protein
MKAAALDQVVMPTGRQAGVDLVGEFLKTAETA